MSRGMTLSEIALFGLELVLVAGLAMAVLGPAIGKVMEQLSLGDLEMTRHAAESHADEINAEAIRQRIDKGGCPQLEAWVCPQEATLKVLCTEPDSGKTDSVVLAVTNLEAFLNGTRPEVGRVITGYRARTSYWRESVRGCIWIPLEWLP